MSSMNHSGEAPPSNNDDTINGVKKPMATYNLDDFALPHFVLKTLDLTVPPDVRTWRELADYVRANLRILPPFTLEKILKIQADYSNAGPAERTSIPAMIPTIKHAPIRGGKSRGGTTRRGAVTATPTKTNINVPGAAQSQGLAQIAIGPRESLSDIWRKEAIPANVGVASGVLPGVTREQQLQTPRKEAITAGVSAMPGLSHEQVLRKEAISPNMIAPPGYPRAPPQVSRKEAIPTRSSATGAHREQPSQARRKEATPANWSAALEHTSQVSRKEATPVNWSAAPGAHREHPSLTWRKETVPVTFNAAPGAHREHPSLTWRKETVPVNFNAAPGAHREHPSLTWRKETIPENFNAAPGAHREQPSLTSRKETVPVKFNAAPGAHREHSSLTSRKETVPVSFNAAPGAHRERPSQSSLKETIQSNWSAESEAHRENSPYVQASRQEAVPMNLSASSGLPHQSPSETQPKEAIPAKVGVEPAILMRGTSKQKVISTATEAAFEQAKPAMANSAKEAPQGMQKLATRDTAKGDQSLKSVSVNSNTNEKAKSSKSASKDQVIGKMEVETKEMVPTPMGELIDLSIPINARSPPRPFHPVTQGRHLNGYTTTGQNNPLMPSLADIPALIPTRKSDPQPLHGPQPGWQSLHPRMPFRAMLPPAAPPRLTRNSSSTRSQSPSVYSRTPSPEKPKAAKPEMPKQAGRYYLVQKDGGVDYVWVKGAQRGDPCPPHLTPVE